MKKDTGRVWGAVEIAPQIDAAVPICYEVLDKQLVADMEGDVILSVSADMYDVSGEASWLLSKLLYIRARESGVPALRVSDSVGSVVVDFRGHIAGYFLRGENVGIFTLYIPKRSAHQPRPILPTWLLCCFLLSAFIWRFVLLD